MARRGTRPRGRGEWGPGTRPTSRDVGRGRGGDGGTCTFAHSSPRGRSEALTALGRQTLRWAELTHRNPAKPTECPTAVTRASPPAGGPSPHLGQGAPRKLKSTGKQALSRPARAGLGRQHPGSTLAGLARARPRGGTELGRRPAHRSWEGRGGRGGEGDKGPGQRSGHVAGSDLYMVRPTIHEDHHKLGWWSSQ